ncbi:MAG: ribonuclease HII [Candidatus Dependentiae bacterium]|nr:ribonuclease HII [Candidatus Dependentiae bacterium]
METCKKIVTQKITEKFKKDSFEHAAWAEGSFIVGVDEVGRGCLAGPVVTAAVALFPHVRHALLKDSKLLTQPELQKAYRWLMTHCHFAVTSCSHLVIDRVNIYQATRIAMDQAVANLLFLVDKKPQYVLIDAVPLPFNAQGCQVRYFTKGERRSSSIAAASIIAKVTRDRLMERLSELFPAYNFAHHKGYGTKEHRAAIGVVGRSLIHRTSFSLSHEEEELDEQQQLF